MILIPVVLLRKYKCTGSIARYISSTHIGVITDLLGVNEGRVHYLIGKHKLKLHEDLNLLISSIKFCQSRYSNEEILMCPKLICQHPVKLEQHYLSMEEGGFHNIKPHVLLKAVYYMRRSVDLLKSAKLIPKDTNVIDSFLSYIHDKDLVQKLEKEYNDNSIWNQIHFSILYQFLKERLNATDDDLLVLFRTHKMIKNKSFRVIQENIAIAEDLGFLPHKILKYGYLLHNFPKHTKKTLDELSNLAGADMRKAMREYPKLVTTPPSNIVKVYGILKCFDISDEAIRKRMNVFHMSPETVKLRLQEIQDNPDLRPLLKHNSILKLIVHHNRAKSRLSFLQQLQLKCASMVVLGADENKDFETYIREGKDVNRKLDLRSFLESNFKADTNVLIKKLKQHPFYLQVPLKNMQETYDYLVNNGFNRSHIYKVIHVLLYPKNKIARALRKLTTSQLDNRLRYKSLSPIDRLNLILYYMEKEHHFTGNGIWLDDGVDVPESTLE